MENGIELVIAKGAEPGKTFLLDEPTLILGRDPRNPIVIDHPQVSRRHARITRQGDAWAIEDLGSTNGTFVNGTDLVGTRALVPGDVIGLGEAVTLTVRQKESADAPRVPPERHPQSPPPPHRAPARGAAPVAPDAQASPPPYRSPSPPLTPQAEARQDRTWLWIGAGCVILLLIAACAAVLILGYLGLLPSPLNAPL